MIMIRTSTFEKNTLHDTKQKTKFKIINFFL